ncbi:MAG TPA: class I SAM-dependent methyltransferase [Solirubrobacteraceae bacterium]|jgi:SAM-dependent methyltransferase|nr:class I SAM-dependent methyltransferase [Solirubrobacteraceae bacterium]
MTTVAPDGFPIPPRHLITRAGATPGGDVVAEYLAHATGLREHLMSLLAQHRDGGAPAAPRILDFGCGAGNALRHFGGEASRGEVWGCDIDAQSVAWLTEHFSPPFRICQVATDPPFVPAPDDHFDLTYAISVFTHVAQDWASWLLELHRVASPAGIVLATILSEGMAEAEAAGPWDPDRVGMNVLRYGQDWDGGGPTVFLSDWWIHAHWGRAFEILDIRHERDAAGAVIPGTHGWVAMRKRDVVLTASELEARQPDEPRELAALLRNIEQLHADDRRLRVLLGEAVARGDTEHARRLTAENRVTEFQEMLAHSHSWRLTAPFRSAARRVRRRRAARLT